MLLERSGTSIFQYFGVTVPAFLCSSTLQGTAFQQKNEHRGFQTRTKNHFKKNSKNASNTGGGALMKHFPSAVHWETREAALPRRRRLGYLARHGIMRARHGNIWHGTDPPDLGTARHGTSLVLWEGPGSGFKSFSVTAVVGGVWKSGISPPWDWGRKTRFSNGLARNRSKVSGSWAEIEVFCTNCSCLKSGL